MSKNVLPLSIWIACLLYVIDCGKLESEVLTKNVTTTEPHHKTSKVSASDKNHLLSTQPFVQTTVSPNKNFTLNANRTGRLYPFMNRTGSDQTKLEKVLQGNTTKYIPRSGDSGNSNETQSVNAGVVGNESKLGYFPAQADVKDAPTGKHKCSGTLVEDKHILTSAHCVSKSKPNELAVMAGDVSLLPSQASTRETRRVQLVAVHPDYIDDEEVNLEFNIAILKLDMPFARGNYLHPAVIPIKSVANNTLCFLVGWGTGEGSSTKGITTFNLLYSDVQTMDMEQCYKCVGNAICAGKNESRACIGDEGGSLMCNGVLHGIYIASANNCQALTGIYTDVVFYKHWIDRVIDWVGDGPMPVPLPYARKRTFTVPKTVPSTDSQGMLKTLNKIFKLLPILVQLI